MPPVPAARSRPAPDPGGSPARLLTSLRPGPAPAAPAASGLLPDWLVHLRSAVHPELPLTHQVLPEGLLAEALRQLSAGGSNRRTALTTAPLAAQLKQSADTGDDRTLAALALAVHALWSGPRAQSGSLRARLRDDLVPIVRHHLTAARAVWSPVAEVVLALRDRPLTPEQDIPQLHPLARQLRGHTLPLPTANELGPAVQEHLDAAGLDSWLVEAAMRASVVTPAAAVAVVEHAPALLPELLDRPALTPAARTAVWDRALDRLLVPGRHPGGYRADAWRAVTDHARDHGTRAGPAQLQRLREQCARVGLGLQTWPDAPEGLSGAAIELARWPGLALDPVCWSWLQGALAPYLDTLTMAELLASRPAAAWYHDWQQLMRQPQPPADALLAYAVALMPPGHLAGLEPQVLAELLDHADAEVRLAVARHLALRPDAPAPPRRPR